MSKRSPKERQCPQCDKWFVTTGNARYCGLSCGQKARAEREGRTLRKVCRGCGCVFYRKSAGRRNKAWYCTRECAFANRPRHENTKVRWRNTTEGTSCRNAISAAYVHWANSWRNCCDCGSLAWMPWDAATRCHECRKRRNFHLPVGAEYKCCDCGAEVIKQGKTRYSRRCAACRQKHVARVGDIRNSPILDESGREVSRLSIYRRDKWICWMCGKRTNPKAEKRSADRPALDHVRPLSKGGEHRSYNLACACWECNTAKAATVPAEMLACGMVTQDAIDRVEALLGRHVVNSTHIATATHAPYPPKLNSMVGIGPCPQPNRDVNNKCIGGYSNG